MTTAVCFKCGAMEFGAFSCCEECGTEPETEDDLVYSLAITDHYFDEKTLTQIGESIRAGKRPQLDEDSRERILATLRETGISRKLQSDGRCVA